MKVNEIISILETLAPPSVACEWDNVGLQLGRGAMEISGIYVALDPTSEAIAGAKEAGCNFLLTHHPLIFTTIQNINEETSVGRRLLEMIDAGMAYYAMHTNYDAAPGMMADYAAQLLGLSDCVLIEGTAGGGGLGRAGRLQCAMGAAELAAYVKERLRLPEVRLYEAGGAGRIEKVAIMPGSGRDEIPFAAALGAQAYITGDVTHHTALDAIEDGMTVIDATHYGTEWIFTEHMVALLSERVMDGTNIKKEPFTWPAKHF